MREDRHDEPERPESELGVTANEAPAVTEPQELGPHHAAPYNDPLPHVPPDAPEADEPSTIADPGARGDEGDRASEDWMVRRDLHGDLRDERA